MISFDINNNIVYIVLQKCSKHKTFDEDFIDSYNNFGFIDIKPIQLRRWEKIRYSMAQRREIKSFLFSEVERGLFLETAVPLSKSLPTWQADNGYFGAAGKDLTVTVISLALPLLQQQPFKL